MACVDKICDQFTILKYDNNPAVFLKYIKDNDFDFYAQGNEHGKNRIDSLRSFDPIKLSLFALRYILSKCLNIDNIIFLFDELEEAGKGRGGEDLEIKIVELAYTIKHLLSERRAIAKEKESFRFTVLISCRHYVYRMITNKKKIDLNEFWNRVNAESQTETMIDIPNSPPLIDLLKRRKEVIAETLTTEKKEEFNEIFLIAYKIISRCDEEIMALAIGNIRDAFKYIQYLLLIKDGFKKDKT